jgi:perosamine synthetase
VTTETPAVDRAAAVPAARVVFSAEDRAEVLRLIDESLRTGALTLGPITERFETAFAARHDVEHAIATSSGTSALEIILRCLDVDGAGVVVPTNTFFATAAAVRHAGGIPQLADVAADTLALSAATVEAALTDATAGVVLVHIGGVITPEVRAIAELCQRRGLFLVEDAAHAHGADLDGVPAGGFGRAAAFSFYPTKVVTSAEGGMIVTNDAALAAEARVYRDQGKGSFLGGGHVRLGYAWRMSEPDAAIGLVHFGRLDEFIAHRRVVAALYDSALAGFAGVSPVLPPPGATTNYYKYPALLDPGIDRGKLKQRLRDEHGVWLSGEVYAKALHREPVFADLATAAGPLPVAEDVCARQVCLPLHSDMHASEAERVLRALGDALEGA